MNEAEAGNEARAFNADDARAIARSIIESEAGRRCCWSPSAVETVAAIILWETRRAEGSAVVSDYQRLRIGRHG